MTVSHYLHDCARLHAHLMHLVTGQLQDLTVVEKAVGRVRSSGALRYRDIQAILESPHFSAGRQYWSWPGRAEIESAFSDQKLDLWNLPKNERSVIKKLRSVFKTTDAVSVILRFVAPREYGILSAPVEHVLGIQPSTSSIDRYLSYVRDLRSIREKYQFETAAQVDQALWTLQVGVYGGILPDAGHLKRAHSQDRFLRSIKVRNLADGLFEEMPRVDLAEALTEYRPALAGQLAALEFERAVRDYSKAKPGQELESTIEECAPSHLRGDWHWCRNRRNDAVHGGRNLDHHEIADLVRHIRDIDVLTQKRRRS